MSVIASVIQMEQGGGLSFGNYLVKEKQKINDFELNGDSYKVKTHDEITRIEKNGKLLLETVPGATIHNLLLNEKVVTFSAEGIDDTQITMELEPEKHYRVIINDVTVGSTVSKSSGKINFSLELNANPQFIRIEKF